MLSFDFQRLTGSEKFHCPLVSNLFTKDQTSVNPLSCYSYIKGLSNKTFPMAETISKKYYEFWILLLLPYGGLEDFGIHQVSFQILFKGKGAISKIHISSTKIVSAIGNVLFNRPFM